MAAVAAHPVPYLLISGTQPAPEVIERMAKLTAGVAQIEVWEASGHFPHLAHPARFAQRLAASANSEPAIETRVGIA